MKNILRLFSKLFMKSMIKTNIPLVVIIGATGCSKTRLAIEMAKRFNGEIISADSMQVYNGLDVITNKASTEERQHIRHHLIDFLDPLSRFTVTDFRNRALKVINELMASHKVPILVGGTNYYIESILWDVLIASNEDFDGKSLVFDDEMRANDRNRLSENLTKDNIFVEQITNDSFEDVSNGELHRILEELDPKTALKTHPNDRRKVMRSLQIYQQNNRSKSDLIEEQMSAKGGSQLGGPLRFDNSVILWTDCETNVLNQRLDERVDDMIERGLIGELLNFHYNYNKQRISQNLCADYSKGIFQSIGFKEFHNYLLLTEEQRRDPKTKPLLLHGINSLKSVTKRYSKYQLKWIRNRFLKQNDRKVPDIYRLDVTAPQLWTQHVSEPSMAVIDAYINGTPVPLHIKAEPKLEMNENISKQFKCDFCDKRLSGLTAFESHLRSKGHKYQLKKNYDKNRHFYQLLALLKSYEKKLSIDRRKSF